MMVFFSFTSIMLLSFKDWTIIGDIHPDQRGASVQAMFPGEV